MVEVAADTLMLLCGLERFAAVDLCLRQGLQAVATVIAPLMLRQASRDSTSLSDTSLQM